MVKKYFDLFKADNKTYASIQCYNLYITTVSVTSFSWITRPPAIRRGGCSETTILANCAIIPYSTSSEIVVKGKTTNGKKNVT